MLAKCALHRAAYHAQCTSVKNEGSGGDLTLALKRAVHSLMVAEVSHTPCMQMHMQQPRLLRANAS